MPKIGEKYMEIALICERCGKINTQNDDGANLVVDFKQKQISFICQNKQCKHDNIFSFQNWSDNTKKSPLPRMRTVL